MASVKRFVRSLRGLATVDSVLLVELKSKGVIASIKRIDNVFIIHYLGLERRGVCATCHKWPLHDSRLVRKDSGHPSVVVWVASQSRLQGRNPDRAFSERPSARNPAGTHLRIWRLRQSGTTESFKGAPFDNMT